MTKKQKIKTALELLNNGSHQAYVLTQCEAKQVGDQLEVTNKDSKSANFYHIEKVAEVAKALNLEIYATVENDSVKIIMF